MEQQRLYNIKQDEDFKVTAAAKRVKALFLYEKPELITTTKESDINISSKDSKLLDNTLGRSPSPL